MDLLCTLFETAETGRQVLRRKPPGFEITAPFFNLTSPFRPVAFTGFEVHLDRLQQVTHFGQP